MLIRSPKNYHVTRDFSFYGFAAEHKPNPNSNHYIIYTPKLSIALIVITTLTLIRALNNRIRVLLFISLSCDQNRFFPITFQGKIFTLRHGG